MLNLDLTLRYMWICSYGSILRNSGTSDACIRYDESMFKSETAAALPHRVVMMTVYGICVYRLGSLNHCHYQCNMAAQQWLSCSMHNASLDSRPLGQARYLFAHIVFLVRHPCIVSSLYFYRYVFQYYMCHSLWTALLASRCSTLPQSLTLSFVREYCWLVSLSDMLSLNLCNSLDKCTQHEN